MNLGYKFEKIGDKNDIKFQFKLNGFNKLKIPLELKIEAIKIFSKRRQYTYMVPVIYISHKE